MTDSSQPAKVPHAPDLPAPSGPVIRLLAAGLGTGYSPVAPGTVGSLLGIPLAIVVALLPGIAWQAAAIVLLCLAAVPICHWAARGDRGGHDPSWIVLDEVVALPIAYFALDVTSPLVLVAGYVLFRVFDISKLPPVSLLERLPGGLGIAADDWAAAVYANLALRLVLWLVAAAGM